MSGHPADEVCKRIRAKAGIWHDDDGVPTEPDDGPDYETEYRAHGHPADENGRGEEDE